MGPRNLTLYEREYSAEYGYNAGSGKTNTGELAGDSTIDAQLPSGAYTQPPFGWDAPLFDSDGMNEYLFDALPSQPFSLSDVQAPYDQYPHHPSRGDNSITQPSAASKDGIDYRTSTTAPRAVSTGRSEQPANLLAVQHLGNEPTDLSDLDLEYNLSGTFNYGANDDVNFHFGFSNDAIQGFGASAHVRVADSGDEQLSQKPDRALPAVPLAPDLARYTTKVSAISTSHAAPANAQPAMSSAAVPVIQIPVYIPDIATIARAHEIVAHYEAVDCTSLGLAIDDLANVKANEHYWAGQLFAAIFSAGIAVPDPSNVTLDPEEAAKFAAKQSKLLQQRILNECAATPVQQKRIRALCRILLANVIYLHEHGVETSVYQRAVPKKAKTVRKRRARKVKASTKAGTVAGAKAGSMSSLNASTNTISSTSTTNTVSSTGTGAGQPKGKKRKIDFTLSCSGRLLQIISVVRDHKLVALDVASGKHPVKLIEDPKACVAAKFQSKQSNDSRAKTKEDVDSMAAKLGYSNPGRAAKKDVPAHTADQAAEDMEASVLERSEGMQGDGDVDPEGDDEGMQGDGDVDSESDDESMSDFEEVTSFVEKSSIVGTGRKRSAQVYQQQTPDEGSDYELSQEEDYDRPAKKPRVRESSAAPKMRAIPKARLTQRAKSYQRGAQTELAE